MKSANDDMDLYIPCIPTHPGVKVDLFTEDRQNLVSLSWNPKEQRMVELQSI